MNQPVLRIALIVAGLTCCALYPLALIWPAGWAWHAGSPASSDYFMMMVGVYATLGVFLIRASSNPRANRSLILFFIWSSIVHGLIMAAESLQDPAHLGHLVGDVPALLIAAAVLGGLLLRQGKSTA
jgi:hypothetical protein